MKPIDANHDANGANRGANDGANREANDEALYESILDMVESDPHVTQNKLAEYLGTSRRTIQRAMKELKEQEKLGRVNGTRGYWKVNR